MLTDQMKFSRVLMTGRSVGNADGGDIHLFIYYEIVHEYTIKKKRKK